MYKRGNMLNYNKWFINYKKVILLLPIIGYHFRKLHIFMGIFFSNKLWREQNLSKKSEVLISEIIAIRTLKFVNFCTFDRSITFTKGKIYWFLKRNNSIHNSNKMANLMISTDI